ncbi:hypothetical protein NCAS_0B05960 [Naumovozyma castellii]|uniref:N(6)-L-threonylcarbamoyladenine synthase n=1 Tax=Naumovozyma castellii TaxID=27288 RepID=G0V9R3_NAUCA|nr:hypothetical protein NCAS_0B05960 [Naumovozyma castellii CBS 4309]CCC68680.1 hypothetical protein NCAS_0B05960 [Naumovozyma castellii CBS 4309]
MFQRSLRSTLRRAYNVLAIETSCDDTCVSLIERTLQHAQIIANFKSTLNSVSEGGIIPTKAQEHHQLMLSQLVKKALGCASDRTIDLVCATRGPGMVGSLSTGLSVAKGLALAWNVPLVGVHHMLGHLLVPRMFDEGLQFPFVTLLVSGGHTCLVLSEGLFHHEILCDTMDIAIGDSLDKCGREIGIQGNMIGREMEKLVAGMDDLDNASYRMVLPNPLIKKNIMGFSFAPFITAVKKHLETQNITDANTQMMRNMAFQIQESIFDHLVNRLQNAIKKDPNKFSNVKSFVCSGGVSANYTLRSKLEANLRSNFNRFYYPPLEFCTDNSVMIGWAGIELFESKLFGHLHSDLNILPIRKWSLTEIMNKPGWVWDGRMD